MTEKNELLEFKKALAVCDTQWGAGQLLSSARILSNSSISFLFAKRTAGFSLYICAPQSGHRSGSFSAEKQ